MFNILSYSLYYIWLRKILLAPSIKKSEYHESYSILVVSGLRAPPWWIIPKKHEVQKQNSIQF